MYKYGNDDIYIGKVTIDIMLKGEYKMWECLKLKYKSTRRASLLSNSSFYNKTELLRAKGRMVKVGGEGWKG